jgi:AraC-like DNA-binding protein
LPNAKAASSILQVMGGIEFRDRLKNELGKRRQVNPRYSLRAFATFLGTNHSTVSQVLRGKRCFPAVLVRQCGEKLGLTTEEIATYIAARHVLDPSITKRQEQLRHWTAEALAIMDDKTHWQILDIARSPGFHPDSRWIARQLGVSVDAVNIAISRLLRLHLLKIDSACQWKVCLYRNSESEFRRRALIRVRELAADHGVKLESNQSCIGVERSHLKWASQ